MLLNSHGNCKNGVQKGSGIGRQPRWMPSLSQLPPSASLCNESAQLSAILEHCEISIIILVYAFPVHSFFCHLKQSSDSYLPSGSLQWADLKKALHGGNSELLLWPAVTLPLKLLALLWHFHAFCLQTFRNQATELNLRS